MSEARRIQPAPVRKTVRVNASRAHAFDVFTAGISRWWPASHTILKAKPKVNIIEPRVGGRWYAIGEDDSECDTGRVLVWDPPRRLVLAWQINADWKYDPGLVTEVEVRFIAESAEVTRVELEHRHLERLGQRAESVRTAVDASNGWSAILALFAGEAERSREAPPVC